MSSFATIPRRLNAFADEKITVSSTAVSLTTTTYMDLGVAEFDDRLRAQAVLITVEDNSIRYRITGSAPTTSVGHILHDGDILWLDSPHAIANFKAIAIGSNAAITVTYLR